MLRTVTLTPLLSITPFLEGGTLVAFNVGPEGYVYLVIALKPLDYRFLEPGSASFAKTQPEIRQNYRVIAFDKAQPAMDLTVQDEAFNIHHIQPLGDELLLVCARSYRRSENDFDKNGRIYSREGKFIREILLGDGIQSVQTTFKRNIWTSFFDEGIFGNYGWEEPVGAAGLLAWDATGKIVYEFEPNDRLDYIIDCYALNVVSEEEVWFYYDSDFYLICLKNRSIAYIYVSSLISL